MREARPAFRLGCRVELVQRGGKGGGFLFRQRVRQILIKGRFDLRFGEFQALRLFRGVQQLTAPVVGGVPADEVALRFQIFCSSGDGGFVRVQQLRQRRLCTAGIVAQGVDQVDLRRADAGFPHGAQNQLFRLPGDFGDFPFRNVHGSLLTRCRYIVVCTTIMPRAFPGVNSKMRPVSRFVGKRGAVSLVMAL